MIERLSSSLENLEWARAVERLLYVFPPVVGVGAVGVLREADPGVPLLERGLVLFGTVGYTLLTIGLSVAIFLDARDVRDRAGPDGEPGWRPDPLLNAVGAFVWPPIAGVVYLARRHRQFGTPAGGSAWWVVVAVTLATTPLGIGASILAYLLAVPGLLAAAVGLAGAIAVGTFPVAIHRDAASVSAARRSWRPNPGLYLGLAFLSLFVPIVQPVLAGYYLWRRHGALGTP